MTGEISRNRVNLNTAAVLDQMRPTKWEEKKGEPGSSGLWIFRIKDQGYLCIPAAACLAKMSVHLSASNLAAGWHCCVTITNPHKDDWSERFVGKWQEWASYQMTQSLDHPIIGSENLWKGSHPKKIYSQAKPSRPEFAHPINALHCKEARARMSSCVLGVRIKMVFCFVLFTRRRSLQLQALIRRAFWHTLMTGGLRHQIINNTRVATSKREEENMRCGVISRLSQVDR